jgi:hypothetical protein
MKIAKNQRYFFISNLISVIFIDQSIKIIMIHKD